jgi:hypothetical protein
VHTRKKENMTATFKCKTNGNTVTFRDDVDIVGMRLHPEYDEVYPEEVQSYPETEQKPEQPVVKRGRPRRAEFEDSLTAKKD